MSDFKDLVSLVRAVRDEQLLEDFLVGITTEKERQDLVQRVEIVKRLLAKQPQQQIARDLGVGIATVTRGSKELSAGRFKALRSNYEK
jgi:TrpR family trp operon transcriptional repressor